MSWIVVQLSSWAEKQLSTKDIAQELRRRTKTPDLDLFYPATEDAVGKHQTAYSEYLFVENREGVSYSDLEGNETFRQVLRDPTGEPRIIEDEEIEKIRNQIEAEENLKPGDNVEVLKGPHKGNRAEVVDYSGDQQVLISVSMGDDTSHVVLPRRWVRKKSRPRPTSR